MTSWNMNAMRNASALHDTDEKRLPSSRGPYRSFGICADAERTHPLKICEHFSMQQRAVGLDFEREQSIAERFSNQQFAVRQKSQAERPAGHVRDDRNLAVQIDAEDLAGARVGHP